MRTHKKIWELTVKRRVDGLVVQTDTTRNLTFPEAASQGRNVIGTYVSEGWQEDGGEGVARLVHPEIPYVVEVSLDWQK